MPLRVNSDWSSVLMDVKKNAQHVKIKKPSRHELYEDAARILEELFSERLEDQFPGHPHRRRRTDPLPSQVVQVPVDNFCEQVVLEDRKPHTLPSNPRQYINQGLKQRDANTLGRKTSDTQHSADAGSISSADTEGDSSSVTDKRRKKTLFRKAKDRLLHAFHRQARERNGDLKDEDRGDAKGRTLQKASPKHKEKEKKKGVVESVVRRLSTKKDNNDGSQSVRSEEKNGSQLPQKEIGRRKNSAGMGLMKYIRRSLSNKKEKVRQEWELELSSGQVRYGLAPDRHHRYLMAASPSPFPQSTSTGSYHDSGNKSSSIHFFGSALGNSSSSSKNVLDYPGEDIQFMDDDGRIRSRHASGNDKRSSTIFFQIPRPMVTVGSGYSNNGTTSPRAVLRGRQTRHLPRAPHISLNNNRGDRGVKGPAHTLCLGPRGGVRTGLTSPIHRPTPRRAPPQPPSGGRVQLLYGYGSWQEDSDDNNGARRGLGGGVLSEKLLKNKTSEKKEKLYSKVAQKVITIADAFSAETGLSDSEAHHKTGYQEAAVSLTDLENLEKEIIDCLRRKGDELSHKIDAPAEKLVEQTKAQTYERFEKTIQHSLGNEVSWNHLALLFYSAKMVVKAVGRSSAATKEVTEMTLRYFSDKFSSWIIDQGGFETLAESDSELE